MPNKEWNHIDPADQMIHRLKIPGNGGMFDGVLLTIEFIQGFEMFNTRPYHNYETWGNGYRLTTHDGVSYTAEDLDDALEGLQKELVKREEENRVRQSRPVGPEQTPPDGSGVVIGTSKSGLEQAK